MSGWSLPDDLKTLRACRDQLVNYEHEWSGEAYNWPELNELIDRLAATISAKDRPMNDLEPCPTCGALPCDQVNTPDGGAKPKGDGQ